MTDNITPISWMQSPSKDVGFIKLTDTDNVGIALRNLDSAETIDGITLVNDVPRGHKLALQAIAKGEKVIKYAQLIGYASVDIAAGDHIHTHNIEFRATEHNLSLIHI